MQALNVRFDQKGHERPFQKAVIVDVVDGYVNAGDRIVIRLGDRRRGPGTRVQTFAEDNFRFRLYVDPLGTSRFVAVPGDISIDIRAGAPSDVLLNGPRFVRPARARPSGYRCRTAGAMRAETQAAPRASSHTTHAAKSTDASTRCPMPAATCAVDDLPVDAGTLRIVADVPARPDVRAAETWLTSDASLPAPVRGTPTCTSTPTIRSAPTARRTTRATHATSAASTCSAIRRTISRSPTNWQLGVDAVEQFNDPGRFVVYPVQEWCGSSTAGGDHNVVFLGDARPDFPYNARGEHARWSGTRT